MKLPPHAESAKQTQQLTFKHKDHKTCLGRSSHQEIRHYANTLFCIQTSSRQYFQRKSKPSNVVVLNFGQSCFQSQNILYVPSFVSLDLGEFREFLPGVTNAETVRRDSLVADPVPPLAASLAAASASREVISA